LSDQSQPARGGQRISKVRVAGDLTQIGSVAGDWNIIKPPRPKVAWPITVGILPPLATAFQARSTFRSQIEATRIQDGQSQHTQVISGGGGVGKSQFVAACASDALGGGVDLLIWADARQIDTVIAVFAEAASRVAVSGTTGSDPIADARALLNWLSGTEKSWLIVLDDIASPKALQSWWPVSRRGKGCVLATTRLRTPILSGSGRTVLELDVFSPEEAEAYLRDRLKGENTHLLDSTVNLMIEELGYLPLALSHAAAYIMRQRVSCASYLSLLNDARSTLQTVMPAWADTEEYGRTVALTLLLALDAADSAEPLGLARPALCLSSVLDPAGHPASLWTTNAVTEYLGKHRTDVPPNSAELPPTSTEHSELDLAWNAVVVLDQYGLVTLDTRLEPWSVRVHPLTARAAREETSRSMIADAIHAGADAIVTNWPDAFLYPDLQANLRVNADVLTARDSEKLIKHKIRDRIVTSLINAGYGEQAVRHSEALLQDRKSRLGDAHRLTFDSKNILAFAYGRVGRIEDAIPLQSQVVKQAPSFLSPDDKEMLHIRNGLALLYAHSDRVKDAIRIQEQLVAEASKLGSSDDLDLFRRNLASSYAEVGRAEEAILIQEQLLAAPGAGTGDRVDSFADLANLAISYKAAGRLLEACRTEEEALNEAIGVLGADHTYVFTIRGNLAITYERLGERKKSIGIREDVVRHCLRTFGQKSRETLRAQLELATAYKEVRRLKDANAVLQRVAANCVEVLGIDDPAILAIFAAAMQSESEAAKQASPRASGRRSKRRRRR
jgi:tetratricopeptide (TPR) repeat protein